MVKKPETTALIQIPSASKLGGNAVFGGFLPLLSFLSRKRSFLFHCFLPVPWFVLLCVCQCACIPPYLSLSLSRSCSKSFDSHVTGIGDCKCLLVVCCVLTPGPRTWFPVFLLPADCSSHTHTGSFIFLFEPITSVAVVKSCLLKLRAVKIVFIVILFFCFIFVASRSHHILRGFVIGTSGAGWLAVCFYVFPGRHYRRPSNVSEHFRGFCRWQHECQRKKNENHTYEEVCRRRSLYGARDPVVCCLFGFYFDSFIKPTPLPQVMSQSRGGEEGGGEVWFGDFSYQGKEI